MLHPPIAPTARKRRNALPPVARAPILRAFAAALMHPLPDLRPAITLLALLPSAAAQLVIESTNYVLVAPNQAAVRDRQPQLEWSARVFETLTGVRPPRGRITLSDAPAGSVMTTSGDSAALINTVPLTPQPPAADGSLWNLAWFTTEKAGDKPRGAGFSVLTHEAAHLQLVYTVNFHASAALRSRFNGYGSFLPDWLDEAVAVYHEPDDLKRARRQRFNLRTRIPLPTYFTMNHPGTTGRAEMIEIEAKTPEEAQQKLSAFKATQHEALRKSAAGLVANSVTVDEFYTQSLAVIEYLAARGGLPFFRFVLVEQSFGRTFREILPGWQVKQREIEKLRPGVERAAAQRKPPARRIASTDTAGPLPPWANKVAGVLVRPGEAVNPMPATLNELEADFVRWVQKNYPRYQPGLPRFPGI